MIFSNIRSKEEINEIIQKVENIYKNKKLNKEETVYLIGVMKSLTWVLKLKDENYIFDFLNKIREEK